MIVPTSYDDVNEIVRTSGCVTSARPASSPEPFTRFSTPGGTPASSNSWTIASDVYGVRRAGFHTTVLPQTSAGAIFQIGTATGKFHGVMSPTMPTGSRVV